jgi:hypothetical protein
MRRGDHRYNCGRVRVRERGTRQRRTSPPRTRNARQDQRYTAEADEREHPDYLGIELGAAALAGQVHRHGDANRGDGGPLRGWPGGPNRIGTSQRLSRGRGRVSLAVPAREGLPQTPMHPLDRPPPVISTSAAARAGQRRAGGAGVTNEEPRQPRLRRSPLASRGCGYCAQDAGGVSTGGTEGQPVRTLSTIGLAACSTTPTEAAILPRLVDRLS